MGCGRVGVDVYPMKVRELVNHQVYMQLKTAPKAVNVCHNFNQFKLPLLYIPCIYRVVLRSPISQKLGYVPQDGLHRVQCICVLHACTPPRAYKHHA